MADNEFGRGDYSEDEVKILLVFSTSKKSTKTGYLTSSTKRCDQATKKGGKNAKGFNYLTSNAKKAFNLLWHMFIQTFILQYFDIKRYILIEIDVLG